mgnify:CR=1 FL=1
MEDWVYCQMLLRLSASFELHLSLESTCRSFEVGVGSSDVGSTVGVDWSEEDMWSLR